MVIAAVQGSEGLAGLVLDRKSPPFVYVLYRSRARMQLGALFLCAVLLVVPLANDDESI